MNKKNIFNVSDGIDSSTEQIAIFVQKSNDSDSTAAALALAKLLEDKYSKSKIFILGFRGKSAFFPEMDDYKIKERQFDPNKKTFGILCEINSKKELLNPEFLKSCSKLLSLDHHETKDESIQEIEGITERINDPNYGSLCELIGDLLNRSNNFFYEQAKENLFNAFNITKRIAEILFLGIYSDSKKFLSSQCGHNTFRIISEMIEKYKIETQKIISMVNERPIQNIQIYCEAMLQAQHHKNLIFINLMPDIVYKNLPGMFRTDGNRKIRQKTLLKFIMNMAEEQTKTNVVIFIHYNLISPFDNNRKYVFVTIKKPNKQLEELLMQNGYKKNRNRFSKICKYHEIYQLVRENLDLFSS